MTHANSDDDLLSAVKDLHEQIATNPGREVWSLDLTRLDVLAGLMEAPSDAPADEAPADQPADPASTKPTA